LSAIFVYQPSVWKKCPKESINFRFGIALFCCQLVHGFHPLLVRLVAIATKTPKYRVSIGQNRQRQLGAPLDSEL